MFGATDPVSATEKVVLVAESREERPASRAMLRQQVVAAVTDLLGMPPDDVVISPPHTVLKTSSGKIRRDAVRQLYERGELNQRSRAVWRQLLRLAAESIKPSWRRLQQRLLDNAYALYAQLLFWLLAPIVWLLVVILPGSQLRWRTMRAGARLLFLLAGISVRVAGIERLPASGSYVLVANHSSYLDGVVLAAALPSEFAFIAKGELQNQLLPRLFLQRIGALFVERFDRQRGVEDARFIEKTLANARSLLYFPEGTLRRAPGLLPFRMGAFTAAAGAGSPVVPIVIKGTRSILRDRSWFPHRGAVTIVIGEPIAAGGTDWSFAIELRNQARKTILAHLDEPDLGQETHLPTI
ncbi:MAG: 1-acyl-sn-glycerol-3-phosphate acyltransferase, partial [Gammaproteobacteria bacterium]|nr:1-acyl-sn-glycerol-3-phosphate acyltransferase [Gammaproteobacteria bacterium]